MPARPSRYFRPLSSQSQTPCPCVKATGNRLCVGIRFSYDTAFSIPSAVDEDSEINAIVYSLSKVWPRLVGAGGCDLLEAILDHSINTDGNVRERSAYISKEISIFISIS